MLKGAVHHAAQLAEVGEDGCFCTLANDLYLEDNSKQRISINAHTVRLISGLLVDSMSFFSSPPYLRRLENSSPLFSGQFGVVRSQNPKHAI